LFRRFNLETSSMEANGTSRCVLRFLRMRIREEDCNMVLLAGVTLLSVAVAGGAAWLEPATATGKNRPVYVANATTPSPNEKQALRLADQPPVRVVGAPFVPNTNPRER
jgi:hypothetical protein